MLSQILLSHVVSANYEHPNIVTEKPVTKAKIALLPAAPVTQTEDASRIITVASEEERGSTRQSSGRYQSSLH